MEGYLKASQLFMIASNARKISTILGFLDGLQGPFPHVKFKFITPLGPLSFLKYFTSYRRRFLVKRSGRKMRWIVQQKLRGRGAGEIALIYMEAPIQALHRKRPLEQQIITPVKTKVK